MILQKLPDYEGGFITKEIDGQFLVTRDADGEILSTQPVNIIKKGLRTEFGKVHSIDGDRVTLIDGAKERTADKTLLNAYLLERNFLDTSVASILPSADGNSATAGAINKSLKVSGVFETPIGNVEVSNFDEEIREVLTAPDKIEHQKGKYLFHKKINKSLYSAEVEEKSKIPAISKIAGISTEKVFKSLSIEPERRVRKGLKLFNINQGTTTTPGSGWNQKGGVKPGHKYIERKPHPSGEGYIYLYQLPSGKRVWRDKNGNTVKGIASGETEKGRKGEGETELTKYEVGDVVRKGNKIGRVEKVSTNFIGVNFEGKKEAINIKEHLEKVSKHAQFKEKDIIDIDYEGERAKILRVTQNLALIKELGTGKYKTILLEKAIEKVDKPSTKKEKRLDRHGISKYNYVEQGYAEDERKYNYEGDYENDPEYKEFTENAEKAGFGRVDDFVMRKYVKVGDTTHQVTWEYDPEFRETDFFIDGIREFTMEFAGKDYLVRDVNEKGYSLEDPETNETGIFLDHKEYKKWKEEKAEKEKSRMVIKRDRFGETISDKGSKTVKYTPEYTQEELDRFAGKGYGRHSNQPVQSEKRKAEILKEQEQKEAEIKKTLQSEAYQKFKGQIEDRGFELGSNRFIGKKKVEIEGRKFEARAQFNPKTQQYETEVTGPYQEIIMEGEKYPITDISEDKVYYRKGNYEKEISIDELKKLNGKTIFKPGGEAKGVVSSLPSTKIYFGTDEKNAVSGYYEIIEADDLITSHLPGGEANPNYTISNAQNRDRTTAQSLNQINKIAQNPNFDFLSDSRTAQDGAPVVNEEYNSIAGNGRGIGVKLHYEQGGQKYKEQLFENLEKLGFNREDIKKMKNPVLVRKIDVDNNEAQRLGAISNQDNKLALEERETAKGMATRIDDQTINKLSDIFTNAKGDFSTISEYLDTVGPEVVKELIRKDIIPENERHLYFDQNSGRLNQRHKDKLRNLLTQSLLGEASKEYELIPDSAREGITKSLGVLFSLKGKDGDLVPHLQNAVKILAKYNSIKDNFKGTDDFLSQARNDAFEPLKADKKDLALFELFAGTKPNEMKEKIREYKTQMDGDMFGEGLQPDEAFDEVFTPKYPNGINKSLRSRAKLVLKSAISLGKNILLPSKKNPRVRRWQKHEYEKESDQLGLFGQRDEESRMSEKGKRGEKIRGQQSEEKISREEYENIKDRENSQRFNQYERLTADSYTSYFEVKPGIKVYKKEYIALPDKYESVRDSFVKEGEDMLGYTTGGNIYLREGLDKNVFVKVLNHELSHIEDKWHPKIEEEYPELKTILNGQQKSETGSSSDPELQSYSDVESWLNKKSEEYGSKNKFLASEEYKKAYPKITELHKQVAAKYKNKAETAMKEAGLKYGDRVEYSAGNPFGEVFVFEGILVEKNGVPKVKLDEKTPEGKRYLNWHKGFKKISSNQKQLEKTNSDVSIKATYDAFKKNNAPMADYIDEHGRERKAYDDEAYKKYMDVSDETGKKIRWGVELSDGRKVSFDGAIRITKPDQWKKITEGKIKGKRSEKLWKVLSKAEQEDAVKAVPEELGKLNDAQLKPALSKMQHPFADVYEFRKMISDNYEFSQMGNKDVKNSNESGKLSEEENKVSDEAVKEKPPEENDENNSQNSLQIYTENFKKWFGDWENDPENASKVVDENGEPLVVYHWTDKNKEFNEFRVGRDGMIWFSDSKTAFQDPDGKMFSVYLDIKNPLDLDEEFEKYTLEEWENILTDKGVNTANLQWDSALNEDESYWFGYLISNWDIELNNDSNLSETIKASGFDGIFAPSEDKRIQERNYVVFNPNQIKSAIGNKGSFD